MNTQGGTITERRCADCGAPVTDEHLALAAETGQEPFCWECWGEHVVWAAGDELADLQRWAAFVEERRMHTNGGWGEEPTVLCDGCGRRIVAAEAWHSLDGGKPICGRCHQGEQAEVEHDF